MKICMPKVMQHLPDGIPTGEGVVKSTKMYEDVLTLYENPREDNPIVYEVYRYSEGENVMGNLNWGLTCMKPILSNGECNMTKGHFHENRDCIEYYFCLKGEGLLLLMDEDGKTWAEKMVPGSLHYISGHYAHRCVNTSDSQELWFGACWPTSAGYDYESIEKREFGYRIKLIDGEIVCEERL